MCMLATFFHLYSLLSRMHTVAPGPPRNLEVVNVFHVSLGLRWDPPLNPNGVITSYRVSQLLYKNALPYCPEQAPMGTRSSSTKIWGWAVTRRMCLNGSTIPEQGPTPDVKLAAMGPNWLSSSVRPCFVVASPTVEKAVLCYRVDLLVASLLSFRSVQSLPAVHEFRAAGEERCEPGHGQVCEPDVVAPKAHQSFVSSADLPSDSLRKNLAWWVVTRRTLKTTKPSKVGGGVWALAQDNTVL